MVDGHLVDEAARLRALHRYSILDTAAEEGFDRIARVASAALRAPISAISFIDAERQWFKARVGLEVPETPRNIAFCRYAILARQPLIVPDATADKRFADNTLVRGAPGVRAYIGAPLATPDGFNLGSLCVLDTCTRPDFNAEKARILSDLAEVVTQQMELRLIAQTDALTGIAGRRHFLAELEREAGRAQRYGRTLSLAMLDIDDFKQVNDTHGHPLGDEVLRAVVGRLSATLRDQDILGRLGGEEFGILLPETSLDQAAGVARRLCHAVSSEVFVTPAGPLRLSVSLGVAGASGPGLDSASLIRRADAALYRAKDAGRNRVSVAGPEADPRTLARPA